MTGLRYYVTVDHHIPCVRAGGEMYYADIMRLWAVGGWMGAYTGRLLESHHVGDTCEWPRAA